ncbi:hypothetical protein [Maribacter sp. 2210JD10-5]|uniref:hypothetical protein n=1 Tax=Maribacter sp. 2210JD10-5 TaxID=3386272 RepID=UPI0039BD7BAC
MKKVASIFAVALMTLGLTTYVNENSSSEFEGLTELNNIPACDECEGPKDNRGGGII